MGNHQRVRDATFHLELRILNSKSRDFLLRDSVVLVALRRAPCLRRERTGEISLKPLVAHQHVHCAYCIKGGAGQSLSPPQRSKRRKEWQGTAPSKRSGRVCVT